MAPFDHFSVIAPLYDRLIHPDDVSRLRDLGDLGHAGRILDAAGGTGRVSSALSGLVGSITLADSSWGMLRQARTKGGLHPVAARIESLPFPSGCFDRVIMVDAFHHLADQARSLQEMWRVLAADGRLVIEEPDIHKPAIKLIAILERLLLMQSRFWTAEAIAGRLSRMGAGVGISRRDSTAWIVATRGSRS